MDNKVIVIDLDGTFVNINTFHKWIKFLFIEELKKVNLISMIKILSIICLRYFKLINHQKMKFLILKVSEKVTDTKQVADFVKSLSTSINSNVLNVLNEENNITILATAAPLLYSKVIQEIYGFDYVIATEFTNIEDWEENIRETKRKNLLTLLKKHSLEKKKSILYTDHFDDIPLMQCVEHTYLVNASEKTRMLVQAAKISFNAI